MQQEGYTAEATITELVEQANIQQVGITPEVATAAASTSSGVAPYGAATGTVASVAPSERPVGEWKLKQHEHLTPDKRNQPPPNVTRDSWLDAVYAAAREGPHDVGLWTKIDAEEKKKIGKKFWSGEKGDKARYVHASNHARIAWNDAWEKGIELVVCNSKNDKFLPRYRGTTRSAQLGSYRPQGKP